MAGDLHTLTHSAVRQDLGVWEVVASLEGLEEPQVDSREDEDTLTASHLVRINVFSFLFGGRDAFHGVGLFWMIAVPYSIELACCDAASVNDAKGLFAPCVFMFSFKPCSIG